MGRKVDVDDLVGAREIASRFRLTHRESFHRLRRLHPDFPEPVATLEQAMVWAWSDVKKWADKHGRPTYNP